MVGSLPSLTCLFSTSVPGAELRPRGNEVFSSGAPRVRDRGSLHKEV